MTANSLISRVEREFDTVTAENASSAAAVMRELVAHLRADAPVMVAAYAYVSARCGGAADAEHAAEALCAAVYAFRVE